MRSSQFLLYVSAYRSTFVTHGNYGGHWTGDISAHWEDLRTSIVGVLDFNVRALRLRNVFHPNIYSSLAFPMLAPMYAASVGPAIRSFACAGNNLALGIRSSGVYLYSLLLALNQRFTAITTTKNSRRKIRPYGRKWLRLQKWQMSSATGYYHISIR